jgi:pantoate--beta-alanine ligase
MNVVRSSADLRAALDPYRRSGSVIGLIPTMGALHEGHLSLIRLARRSADAVVVSIFVNPLQFGPGEDLATYPRSEQRDLDFLEEEKADVVFVPSRDEMYPQGSTVRVSAGSLGLVLEGATRPGHFDGVCTVVSKLFNLVEPDLAFFGQKDAQQVAVVKRMVRDLSYRVRIEVGPTVREDDGLALSSRNAYLSSDERSRASAIYRALEEGARVVVAGGGRAEAESSVRRVITSADLELDYARVVDPEDFEPWRGGPALLVVAARAGSTRLIDNLLVGER